MYLIQPIRSEFDPYDKYKKQFPILTNTNAGRTPDEIKDWSSETNFLAKGSVWSYLGELPIKIASYFASHSDYNETTWSKGVYFLERITGAFGDLFRNLIYAHKTKEGKRDDIIGGELLAEKVKEEESELTLPVINNRLQTIGRFVTSAISLVSPTVANDLDWAIIHATDSWWWRDLSINISFGADFRKKLLNKIFKRESNEGTISWESIKNTFHEHSENLRIAWNNIRNSTREEKNNNKRTFYEHADKTISSFIPVVNIMNIIGDISRPIARRLAIEGIPRNLIRVLSVIDKPFAFLTNIFRYYLPERAIQKADNNTNILIPPNVLLASLAGEAIDFSSIVMEDKIKESNILVQHTVEIARRITGTLTNIYFAARRRNKLV